MLIKIGILLLLIIIYETQSFVLRSGEYQSPINIDLSKTIYTKYPSFNFSDGYFQPTVFQVTYEYGKTISITAVLESSKSLTISGGSLSGVFTFQNVHLHWPQSEHKFLGKTFTAEAHFVHKNFKTNETAVFAYFFSLSGSDSDSESSEHDKINNWENILNQTSNNTINITIQDGLSSLMKGDKHKFISYIGSLTTSPYTEGVHWILMSSNIKLRQVYLNRIQTNIVRSNYRVTQPINGRTIRRSFIS